MTDHDTASTRKKAAEALLAAYADKTPIAPLTSTFEGLSIEDAYKIQLAQIDKFLDSGRTIKGMKVGLTSAAMQNLLGVLLLSRARADPGDAILATSD